MRIGSGGGAPISRSKTDSSNRLAWYRLTAHPTPKTRSLKSWFESGFQYAARMRSHVGGRKSYGTAPQTFPCHVRSSSGLDNSEEERTWHGKVWGAVPY